jgi:uncharacterized protein (TIGR00730 family)
MSKSICVFCGSSSGKNPDYIKQAKALGTALSSRGHQLIYGGASIGVMGALANSWIEGKGKVVGIMPQSIIDLEIAHNALHEFIRTENMHERKQLMHDMSDLFIALPGGMGTMDELCETITWAQLEFHKKKVVIFNYNNYYDHFIAHIRRMNQEGFYSDEHMRLFVVCDSVEQILESVRG